MESIKNAEEQLIFHEKKQAVYVFFTFSVQNIKNNC